MSEIKKPKEFNIVGGYFDGLTINSVDKQLRADWIKSQETLKKRDAVIADLLKALEDVLLAMTVDFDINGFDEYTIEKAIAKAKRDLET